MSKPIELGSVLAALDLNSKEVWDELSEEQRKKDINLFTLKRYLATTLGSRKVQEHYVLTTNERYNKHLFSLMNKHPQLAWQLACSCTYNNANEEQIFNHKWLAVKQTTDKKIKFLQELFPNMKNADIETLASINSTQEIKQYCEGLGWDKKQVSAIKF